MPKPMSRSVKVRLGKQDSSSSSFFLNIFLKSIALLFIFKNEPEGADAGLLLAAGHQPKDHGLCRTQGVEC